MNEKEQSKRLAVMQDRLATYDVLNGGRFFNHA